MIYRVERFCKSRGKSIERNDYFITYAHMWQLY